MLSRTYRVLPVLFLLCSAGAALRPQHPVACEGRSPKDPGYYNAMREFLTGKFTFGYVPDKPQVDDPSAQVVLTGMVGINVAHRRGLKLGCVEVANRSTRVVRAVQMRWEVRPQAEGQGVFESKEVLAKGVLPSVAVEVQPGVKRRVEIRGVQFADFFWPLAASGEVNGRFNVIIGVARVEFADGTSIDLP